MNKTSLPILIFLSLILFSRGAISQVKFDVTELYKLFQNAADSTVIFQFDQVTIQHEPLFILSKKADTLTGYAYKVPERFDKRIKMPKTIALKIREKKYMSINRVPEDVNSFFEPVYLTKDSLTNFWKSIMKEDPWRLKDDATAGVGCPGKDGKTNMEKYIYDGGGMNLYLITKGEIRRLHYYSPGYFEKEEVCPGRPDRVSILKIDELFESYFNFKR